MKINAFYLACAIFAVLAIVIFAFVAFQQQFPIFNSSGQTSSFVSTSENIGAEDSRFMWTNDGLALIAQAFVLFAAAAATLGLLKAEGEK
jgi:hypothetical protein